MKEDHTNTKKILAELKKEPKPKKKFDQLHDLLIDTEKSLEDIKKVLSEAKCGLNPSRNKLSKYKNLPLIVAVFRGAEFIELLLKAGADPNLPGFFGETAMYHTSMYGHEKSTGFLLEFGADPGMPSDDKGNTILHRLAKIKTEEFGTPRGEKAEPYASFDTYKKIIFQILTVKPELLLQKNKIGEGPVDIASEIEGPMKEFLVPLKKQLQDLILIVSASIAPSSSVSGVISIIVSYCAEFASEPEATAEPGSKQSPGL